MEIIRQCERGVRSFTPYRPTALATDWSKGAIGFWLCQKFCECETGPDPKPGCCPEGWQTIFVGSRFCKPAESRYHPIEGEALAAAYGLEKCKFFVLGLSNLVLCLDHAPLLATFGSQDLEEIPNPRLLNFKIKSLAFRFRVCHIPGKEHVTADALSRRSDHPPLPPRQPSTDPTVLSNVSPGYADTLGPPSWVSGPTIGTLNASEDLSDSDQLEALITGYAMASLAALNQSTPSSDISPCSTCAITHPGMMILSWDRLEAACLSSSVYILLHRTISEGAPELISDWDEQLKVYHKHRLALMVVGPVVLLHDRPVIPPILRQEVLEHLHSGHAGVSTMFARASSTLYWPGYRADITRHRASCRSCDKAAPSNPAEPPVLPDQPAYPFHSITGDFFTVNSRNYLALCDRYSNWLSIFKLAKDDSANIIKTLRDYSTTFGIPAILSTDGASVFTSKQMEEFCKRWGINHRVSSAYYARSNKRAEVGVKSAKRLVRDNLLPDGGLDCDKLSRALLIHRNNPCPVTGLSPSQVLYGRVLRDFLPLQPGKFEPRAEWRQAADDRAKAFAQRHVLKSEELATGSKTLHPLAIGDHVSLQDQTGRTPRAWGKTGVVVEVNDFNSYQVKVDGSRHVTKRNRRFLRKILPFTVQQTLINNYNNQLMPFQTMPTEYEEHCKSLSPVVPYKMDKAKGHRIEDTTEVDSADDGVPPSTPSLMKEIAQMMDRDEARNLTNKSTMSPPALPIPNITHHDQLPSPSAPSACAQPPLPPSTPSRVNSPTAPEADDVYIEESTSPPPPRNPRPACAWSWRCGNKVCARWQRHPGSSS